MAGLGSAVDGPSVMGGQGSWRDLSSAGTSSRNTSLRRFETHQVDGIAEIPANIVEKGVSMWSEYVVGFFVEKRLPFPIVKAALARQWKVKGSYSISTDRELFYFKFNQDEDRKQVLEADSIFIAGKLFVNRQWSREVEAQKTKITSIPIWVKLMDLPKELWTDEGLGYIARLIGEPLRTDEATIERTRLMFAKIWS
ncbi:hypothetical protein IFM89_000077 [Coptis chinensis]|uniref:DUF4283 domain-containing protein n=1 Tax=Coptis chinensis TaxID=261450 RepID=A0A835IM33_9MAGN|nr:hypothetical protein IFM89_000077 [Coptis chinensis]